MSLKLTFKKSSTDFTELVNEAKQVYPEIREFIADKEMGGYTTEEVIVELANAIVKNPPSVFNEDFPATLALNVSANQVSFKTKKFLSFGWYVNISGEEVSYDFRITVFTRNPLTKKGPASVKLQGLGWSLSVRDEQQQTQQPVKKVECEPNV